MVADFRFNGQQSYSPLLSALAEAPVNKAKLAIAQEQNQRQRLSDLLSQISSSATLARTFQTMGAIKRQSDLAGGPNSIAGNSALITPDAFSQGTGQLPSNILGLNAAIPLIRQPAQGGSDQTVKSQTPGSIPLSTDEGVVNPNAMYNRVVNRTLYGEPKQGTDTNSGLTMETYPGSGMSPKIVNPPTEGELDPVSREYLIKRNDAFSTDIKPMVDQIKASKQLSSITSAKIPAAGIQTAVEALKTGGLSRINQYEATQTGKDKSIWENARQTAQGLVDGTITDVNQEQIKALSTVLQKSAQYSIDEMKNSYIDQSLEERPSLGRSKFEKSFGAVARRQSGGSYNPGVYQKGKGLVKGSQSAQNGIDLGNGFSYTVKK